MPDAVLVGNSAASWYAHHRSSFDHDHVLARQLAEPRPAHTRTTRELSRSKRLDPRWQDWEAVVATCAAVADAMVASP